MKSLSNRVAIVSAAGRGIGKGIAQNLGEAGATVIVNSYSPDTTEGTVADIIKAGGTARAMPGDITKPEIILKVTEETIEEFGKIDILVCNAAVNPFHGSITEIPDSAFHNAPSGRSAEKDKALSAE